MPQLVYGDHFGAITFFWITLVSTFFKDDYFSANADVARRKSDVALTQLAGEVHGSPERSNKHLY